MINLDLGQLGGCDEQRVGLQRPFRKVFFALAGRGVQNEWQEEQLTLTDDKARD